MDVYLRCTIFLAWLMLYPAVGFTLEVYQQCSELSESLRENCDYFREQWDPLPDRVFLNLVMVNASENLSELLRDADGQTAFILFPGRYRVQVNIKNNFALIGSRETGEQPVVEPGSDWFPEIFLLEDGIKKIVVTGIKINMGENIYSIFVTYANIHNLIMDSIEISHFQGFYENVRIGTPIVSLGLTSGEITIINSKFHWAGSTSIFQVKGLDASTKVSFNSNIVESNTQGKIFLLKDISNFEITNNTIQNCEHVNIQENSIYRSDLDMKSQSVFNVEYVNVEGLISGNISQNLIITPEGETIHALQLEGQPSFYPIEIDRGSIYIYDNNFNASHVDDDTGNYRGVHIFYEPPDNAQPSTSPIRESGLLFCEPSPTPSTSGVIPFPSKTEEIMNRPAPQTKKMTGDSAMTYFSSNEVITEQLNSPSLAQSKNDHEGVIAGSTVAALSVFSLVMWGSTSGVTFGYCYWQSRKSGNYKPGRLLTVLSTFSCLLLSGAGEAGIVEFDGVDASYQR